MPLRFLLAAFLVVALALPAAAVTDEQVGDAIGRIKAYFLASQDPATGGWPLPRYDGGAQHGGDTALVTLALLVSGESVQDPRLARAIDYLKREKLTGTYAVALRAQVWAQLSEEYRPLLEADARWLLSAADARSRLGYSAEPSGKPNHSTTHYGTLGLWEAARRGVAVPRSFWDKSQQYFLDARQPDGGWGYDAASPSYGSMTAAGVAALLIARQQLYRDTVKPEPQIERGIRRGLAWLDSRFQGDANPGSAGWNAYYLYSVERVALASGLRSFNRQDWFQAGARFFLSQQVRDGEKQAGSIAGDPIDTAYAMMFLARGRVPIWVTKLSLPENAWNNRPNDVAALTDHLSDAHEAEMNWQTVSIDAPPEQWGDVPLAYIASDERLDLTAAQKKAIKRYLDSGGTLLANPDDGSERFARSVRALAGELYPQWPLRKLPAEHPLFTALHQAPASMSPVWGVSNGARELILLADRDWGFAWQSEIAPGRNPAWKIAANLWVVVTDRGLLPNRLVPRFEPRRQRAELGRVVVGRAIYSKDAAQSLPEPAAWGPMSDHLFNRTGMEAQTRDVELESIGDLTLPLIHITGVDPPTLSDAQRRAIAAYLRRGGTLLVETVGGRGYFAAGFHKDLSQTLGNTFVPLSPEHPIVSGRGLEGGYDNREAGYRRFAVAKLGAPVRTRLGAYFIGDRPAAILSQEDLSMGILGVNQWGIIGYRPEAARRVMTNIVLWAAQQKMAP